jgi:hypothetical protein
MRNFSSLLILGCLAACNQSPKPQKDIIQLSERQGQTWQRQVDSLLPLYGHRNWILVVDKAFPALTDNGTAIQVINTNSDIPTVIRYLNNAIQRTPHIKAKVFMDKELAYIPSKNDSDLINYQQIINDVYKNDSIATLLHDSVFSMITQNAKQFQVLVLKTNTCIAYSSVFIRLDCKYWDDNREKTLRAALLKK